MDLAHSQTDELLKTMEKRIQKVYTQAAKETEQKVKDYYTAYERKYAKKLSEMKSGKISKQEFLKWNKGQVMIGKRWEEMRDNIATDLTNADKLAISMINGHLPEVYALNHNYGTFEVEKGSLMDTSYTLYDAQTVERLIRDNPHIIPSPKLNKNKDLRWNKSNFNSGITQGLLQGESIDKIAKRVALGMSDKDYKAAVRNARTAVTGAENAGRMDSYERAAEMGIKVNKIWLAVMDASTRDSHREMDGEEQPYDHEFSNGLMYPGDSGGDPAEVWNCRCTMIADVGQKIPEFSERRNPALGDMTYEEWKHEHDVGLNSTNRFVQAAKHFKNRYGITVSDKVGELNFAHVKQALEGIEDAINEFPVLNGHIKYIGIRNEGYMCSNGTDIFFNSEHFKNGAAYVSNNAYQAGAHEAGHCVDMIVCRNKAAMELSDIGATDSLINMEAQQKWLGNKEASRIVREAVSTVGKADSTPSIILRGGISTYSLTDTSETLAEAVGYEMLKKNRGVIGHKTKAGQSLASEIVSILKKEVIVK